MSEKFRGEVPQNKLEGGEGKKQRVIDESIVDSLVQSGRQIYNNPENFREKLVQKQIFEGNTSYSEKKTDKDGKEVTHFPGSSILPTREQYLEALEHAEAYLSEVRNREHAGATDVLEHLVLIPEDTVHYTYNEHYGVYLEFKPDGTTEVEDEDQHYKVEPGQVFNGVSHFVDRVRKSQEKVTKLLPHIPWGNLGGTKGIRPLIEAFDTVEAYSGYLPDKERDEQYKQDNEKFHNS